MDLRQSAPQAYVTIHILNQLFNVNQLTSMDKTLKYPAQELEQEAKAIFQQIVSLLLAMINVLEQQPLTLTYTNAT
jgi:cell division protein ZapA (FtsZ GTPase activity inhibitor)